MRETRVRFLGREDPLEKEMASHSSTLAWKIPWTEESDMTERLHFTCINFRKTPILHQVFSKAVLQEDIFQSMELNSGLFLPVASE